MPTSLALSLIFQNTSVLHRETANFALASWSPALHAVLGLIQSTISPPKCAAPSALGFFLWIPIPWTDARGYHMPPL